LVEDTAVLEEAAHIGIIFLLFLLGLDLQPQELLHRVRASVLVTLVSSAAFAALGFLVAYGFGFSARESLLAGAAMMFSSTIIGVKLLPTTALHHQRAGEIIISILLLQDLLAIVVLLFLEGYGREVALVRDIALLALTLPGLIAFGFGFSRWVLIPLIRRFNKIHEYIFLVAIGWCLGMAELGAALGLSTEVGAFIAGVSLATSPIALYIAQSLRPLRDFFLVLFFFALGAGLDLDLVGAVLLPATVMALLAVGLKPLVFRALLVRTGESPKLSGEIGVRLGQTSEFSLLIGVMALEARFVGEAAAYLVHITTLISFVLSSYWVVMAYPTPIALSDRLRRD
jgi:Kef-type K+ transport system membrane component KefB